MVVTAEYHQSARTPDGARLSVQVRGSGPVLLMLSGQANNHHWWDRARADFAHDHTTVTFDYRGTGGSSSGVERYATELFARDALTVMDALFIDRFSVYGTSMGGRVAQWLAVLAPQRVDMLVLGCTTPGGEHAFHSDVAVRRRLMEPDARPYLLSLMYNREWIAKHAGPYHVLGDPTMTTIDRQAHLRASAAHDAWDVLPSIEASTLILQGTDDLLIPAGNATLLENRIPRGRVVLFEGARHAYFDEFRPSAAEVVLEALGTRSS